MMAPDYVRFVSILRLFLHELDWEILVLIGCFLPLPKLGH